MNLADKLMAVIAPHGCISCGAEGPLVCSWCHPELLRSIPSRCYRCHKSTLDSKVCQACRKQVPLKHVWITAEYDGHAKTLVALLKFGRARAAAETIAELMSETLPLIGDKLIITGVPTATSRIRQRGYDHSALIARQLAKLQKWPYLSLLGRFGQSRQVGAKRNQRLRQLKNAFYIRKPATIKGRHILIVDDVTTTGATIEAAATELKAQGAKSVMAAIFAQKQ